MGKILVTLSVIMGGVFLAAVGVLGYLGALIAASAGDASLPAWPPILLTLVGLVVMLYGVRHA